MAHVNQTIEALLDGEIQQLVALKQMASNPRLVDLMRQIVAASDSKVPTTPSEHQQPKLPGITLNGGATPKTSSPNGLTEATLNVVNRMKGPFSIPDVVDELKKTGFQFVAAKPKVAVAAPLKSFLKKGKIRLAKQGIGGEPNLYELAG